MHKKKIKVNPVDQVLQVLIYLIIIALCLIILLPCLNVVALAFNDGADAARGGVWFWPREFTLDNFRPRGREKAFRRYFGSHIPAEVFRPRGRWSSDKNKESGDS